MKPTRRAKRRGRGRPANLDPPKLFSTTLPSTIYETLSKLAEAQHRTKSEILTDAIQAYARRFKDLI
jgi:predicted DNA-binding protein